MDTLDRRLVTGAGPTDPVIWGSVQLGDERIRVPQDPTLPLPVGPVTPAPLYVRIWPLKNDRGLHVAINARSDDEGHAEEYLAQLVGSTKGERSPYWHAIVEATWAMGGLSLRRVELDPIDRSSLVLGPEVWDAVQRNVDRMFERMDRLADAGLGTNRGLCSPELPAPASRALCKALAHEYVGRATVTILSAAAGQHLLGQVYERLDSLGPALVLVEDLDLLVGDRERHAGSACRGVPDRARTGRRRGTGAGDGGDHQRRRDDRRCCHPRLPASTRWCACRYRTPPSAAVILEVYLRDLEHDGDLGKLAESSEGFSGADLREVVRSSVLDADEERLSQQDLEQAVGHRRAALASLAATPRTTTTASTPPATSEASRQRSAAPVRSA